MSFIDLIKRYFLYSYYLLNLIDISNFSIKKR